MPERATTTTLRRLTLESGDQEDMPQREMASGTVETLAPMLERALAGDPQVRVPPTDYWFRARQLASEGPLTMPFAWSSARCPLATLPLPR